MKTRLREIREEKRLTLKDVEKLLGKEWSFQTIGNVETGKHEPSQRLIKRLAEVLGVEMADIAPDHPLAAKKDLSAADSPMALREDHASEVRPDPMVYRMKRKVPVVGHVAGANFLSNRAFDYSDIANQIEEYIETTSRDPNAIGLIVEGDSMEPDIRAGDKIVVAPNGEPRNGKPVVARLAEEGSVVVKIFHRSGPEGKTIRLESRNKEYRDIVKDRSEFRFIYPVVKVERDVI